MEWFASIVAQKNGVIGTFQKHRFLLSTGGGTRTHMRLPSPDFESGASANSATPAKCEKHSIYGYFLISKRTSAKETDLLHGKCTAKLKFLAAVWLTTNQKGWTFILPKALKIRPRAAKGGYSTESVPFVLLWFSPKFISLRFFSTSKKEEPVPIQWNWIFRRLSTLYQ